MEQNPSSRTTKPPLTDHLIHHHPVKPNNNKSCNQIPSRKPIWDCGSTLYDSFELNTFQKQLDSAIVNSSRTMSMPRLPSEYRRAPPPQPPQQPSKKPPLASKVSRSFQKLIRSVFRAHKQPNHKSSKTNYDSTASSSPDPWFMDPQPAQEVDHKVVGGGRYIIVYDNKEQTNGLTTIPEIPEVTYSPEITRSLVRKTVSARFNYSSGISCA